MLDKTTKSCHWCGILLREPVQGQLFKCLQELIAIVLGLATFLPEIKGKKVIVYSDNKGAVLDPRVPACSL